MNTDKLLSCQNNTALEGLRKNVVSRKIILSTDGTNGCVERHKVSKGVWHPLHKNILTRVVGVMQVLWPLCPPCDRRESMWSHIGDI